MRETECDRARAAYCTDEIHRRFGAAFAEQRRIDTHKENAGVRKDATGENEIVDLWT